MAPQNVDQVEVENEELPVSEGTAGREGKPLEERRLELNLMGNWENLKNLDYSKVVWRNVILFILLHIYAVYGIFLLFFHCTWKMVAFAYFLYFLSGLGITMGVHRLWAHKSYKANISLRTALAVCNSLAFQNSIYEWARDHRVHHKFSETDADPHNANRGFFFSHMGWLMYRKHPDVIRKGKTVDMSDLENDPVVMFQRKHYLKSVLICWFLVPSLIPWYFWGEDYLTSVFIGVFARYTLVLHFTWFVNSLAHWVGAKPYDREIAPSENPFVATVALGEGWHNYHHVFPFDYRTAEIRKYFNINATKNIIDFCGHMGWAWDLKMATPDMVRRRILRTGDASSLTEKDTKRSC